MVRLIAQWLAGHMGLIFPNFWYIPVRQNNIQSLCKIYSCRLYCCVNFWNCDVRHSTVSTGAIGTSIYTVYSRYNYIHRHCLQYRYSYLHCLQQAQLSTLSTIGTTIFAVNSRYNYLHCQQQVQLSTLSTVGTAVYTVYSRYSCLHCLQQVQLSTLSMGKTIYTVYNKYSYLHCLQYVQLVVPVLSFMTRESKIVSLSPVSFFEHKL